VEPVSIIRRSSSLRHSRILFSYHPAILHHQSRAPASFRENSRARLPRLNQHSSFSSRCCVSRAAQRPAIGLHHSRHAFVTQPRLIASAYSAESRSSGDRAAFVTDLFDHGTRSARPCLDHQTIEQPSSRKRCRCKVSIIRRSSSLRHMVNPPPSGGSGCLDHQATEQPSSLVHATRAALAYTSRSSGDRAAFVTDARSDLVTSLDAVSIIRRSSSLRHSAIAARYRIEARLSRSSGDRAAFVTRASRA
jgi:hypothetical protein